jgi:nucleoside-diphosphate-sugar epimerase
MCDRLLGEWPNTYTYSKMLAEALVTKHCVNMPVAIFRPAIGECQI